jgi:aryl-alcohol dehydrogenase-like predicted oxidoreductase
LTGKITHETQFARDDHRRYNRHGEEFDVGETFAGVELDRGLELVDALRPLVPDGMTMGQLALRWILGFDAVSTVIPGAKTPEQARTNAAASDLPPLPRPVLEAIAELYRTRISPAVDQRW